MPPLRAFSPTPAKAYVFPLKKRSSNRSFFEGLDDRFTREEMKSDSSSVVRFSRADNFTPFLPLLANCNRSAGKVADSFSSSFRTCASIMAGIQRIIYFLFPNCTI